MIEFDVSIDGSGDRTYHLDGVLIGWVERGRDMTDLRSQWTEFQFVPADGPRFPVRRTFAAARQDAVDHVKQLSRTP